MGMLAVGMPSCRGGLSVSLMFSYFLVCTVSSWGEWFMHVVVQDFDRKGILARSHQLMDWTGPVCACDEGGDTAKVDT